MRILCTLPNAAELINGVKFAAHAKGMLSEDVADEVGEALLAIPGYGRHEEPAAAPVAKHIDIDLEQLRADVADTAAADTAAAAAASAPAATGAVTATADEAPAAEIAETPAAPAKRTKK